VAEDSFTIDLTADGDVSSVALFAEVLDPRGEPLSGVFVTFRLRGEGSFDSASSIQTQQRRTSKYGASVTWYEYPVQRPRLPLKGTVTAACPEAESVRLRPGTFLPFKKSDSAAIRTAPLPRDETPQEAGETESAAEEGVIEHQLEPPTDALTEADRSALFAMLSGGTAKHLGREPTVSEFVRLCDAVVLARELATIEGGLLSLEAEVHWTGDGRVINRLEAREERAA
jgi:hypothetical protein